jgi:hypothetical protein
MSLWDEITNVAQTGRRLTRKKHRYAAEKRAPLRAIDSRKDIDQNN